MIDNVSHVDHTFAPIPIETDAAILGRAAQAAQVAWFANPNEITKATFASALRRWGRATGKRDAVEHAEKLLQGEL